MRRTIVGIIIGISITMLISSGIESYVVSKNTANVEMYQNIRVFTDCKPVAEYEYLGTVKVSFAASNQYSDIRNVLIKNARKQYPNSEAIIVNGDKADCIRFK